MESGDKNLNRWVNERMARLDAAAEWRPDADRALVRLGRKERTVRRRRWGIGVATGLAIAAALFTIPGCQAATCKMQSDNLAERLWKSVFERPPEQRLQQPGVPQGLAAPPGASQKIVTSASAARPKPAPVPAAALPAKNYKETGSPAAPVTCEIFTDYECPACARMYLDVVPQLLVDYVAKGKVKLLHRDFPLTQHQFARLAARYANAAGVAGQYDVAVNQLFRTQSAWGLTGDIEAQLAQVLAPAAMAKVRDLVHSDPRLDDGIVTDLERGRADRLNQTPSVVLVANGERRLLPFGDYEALKAAIDEMLRR